MTSENIITISLDDVLGPDGLEGAWESMTRKLADSAASKFLHSEGGKSFHSACVGAIDEAIRTKVAAEIEDRINRPIQQTNNYGEPIGEKTTFNEMIGKAVDDAFTTKVDLYGKRAHPNNRGMFDKTVIEHALQRVALEGIEKEVYKAVAKVREDAKAAVATEIAKAVAKAVK